MSVAVTVPLSCHCLLHVFVWFQCLGREGRLWFTRERGKAVVYDCSISFIGFFVPSSRDFPTTTRNIKNIQSTLVILNFKRLSEILRDIRTSTYPICRIEGKIIRLTIFNKYICNNRFLKLEIYWKYCGKEEKLLLRSNFSSFPQYFFSTIFFTCC